MKNLGLLVLYTLIVFVLASVTLYTHSIKKEASIVLQSSPEIIVQKMISGRHEFFPVDQIEKLKDIRGVSSVYGRLWGYYYDKHLVANYTFLVPPSEAQDSVLNDNNLPDILYKTDLERLRDGTIIIGEGVARLWNVQIGGLVPFFASDGSVVRFTVADTLSSHSGLVSSDLVLITEPDFRRMFGMPAGAVTDAVVSVNNPSEIATVISKIVNIYPDSRPITRNDILRTYDSIFSWRSGMMLVILSAALLAFVIFAWDKASGLSAGERREIGTLKAIGWETSDIIQMKFFEGAFVSLTAFLLGVMLAYVHVFFLSSFIFESALKGWSTLYPRFQLTPFISAAQLTILFFLTVVPYTAATIVPVWRSATIEPYVTMRRSGE